MDLQGGIYIGWVLEVQIGKLPPPDRMANVLDGKSADGKSVIIIFGWVTCPIKYRQTSFPRSLPTLLCLETGDL